MRISIRRCDPDTGRSWHQAHEVSAAPRDTLLEALLQIQDQADDPVAFEYGCRYGRCGLCAVSVNGHPRLACETPLREGLVVEPLGRFPVVRDLVIDRSAHERTLGRVEAFPTRPDTGHPNALPAVWMEPRAHKLLSACNECLACVAACPELAGPGPAHPGNSFPGPAVFGRLAALSMVPGEDSVRFVDVAKTAGIQLCVGCPGCRCPQGVPVWSMGVRHLLADEESTS